MHVRLANDISRRLFVEVLQMLPDAPSIDSRLACLQLLQLLAATGERAGHQQDSGPYCLVQQQMYVCMPACW